MCEGVARAHPQVTEFNQYTYRGEWAARGRVQNYGSTRAFFTRVRADCFDASGQHIGGDYDYVNGYTASTPYGTSTDTTIGPGEIASYDIRYTDIPRSSVASAQTRATWSEYGYHSSSLEEDYDQRLESNQQVADEIGGTGLSLTF